MSADENEWETVDRSKKNKNKNNRDGPKEQGGRDGRNTRLPQGGRGVQDRGQGRNDSVRPSPGRGNSSRNSPRLREDGPGPVGQHGQTRASDFTQPQGRVPNPGRGQGSETRDAPESPNTQHNLQTNSRTPGPSTNTSYSNMLSSNLPSGRTTPTSSAATTPRNNNIDLAASSTSSAAATPRSYKHVATSSTSSATATPRNEDFATSSQSSAAVTPRNKDVATSSTYSGAVTPRNNDVATSSTYSAAVTPWNTNVATSSTSSNMQSGRTTPEGANTPRSTYYADKNIVASNVVPNENRPTPGAIHNNQYETTSWLGYVKTLCQNVFRVSRGNDASYDLQCKEISNDLNIYQGYSRGRQAIFPAMPPSPPDRGEIVEVSANHFKMNLPSTSANPQTQVYLYSVSWICESRGRKLMKDLKKEWWDEMVRKEISKEICLIYDGGSLMISHAPFAWEESQRKEGFTLGSNTEQSVVIKFNQILDWEICIKFLSNNSDEGNVFPKDVIRALNMVMKEYCVRMGYFESGGFYFDKCNGNEVPNKLLILRSGYFQSVRALQGGLTLNVDVMTSAFYLPGKPLHETWNLMQQCDLPEAKKRSFYGWTENSEWNEEQVGIANEHWKNLQIVSSHRSVIDNLAQKSNLPQKSLNNDSNQKRFTIYQLQESRADKTEVEGLYDTKFSGNLCEFIEKMYKLKKGDLFGNMPAIKLSRKHEHYLPWGCCKTTFDSRYSGKIEDFRVLSMMERHPQKRCDDLLTWMSARHDRSGQNSDMTKAEHMFNIFAEPTMMKIQALKLPRPIMEARDKKNLPWYNDPYGDGPILKPNFRGQDFKPNPNFAFKAANCQRFLEGGTVCPWGVLSFDSENKQWQKDFLQALQNKANQLGINWDQNISCWQNAPPANARVSNRERQTMVKREVAMLMKNQSLNLIICFMKHKMNPEYATLKAECDIVYGVPSQVVLTQRGNPNSREWQNKINTMVANLLLKINVKCGGANFRVSPQYLKDVTPNPTKKTILLGADVTHPSGMCSIAAVVATTDSSSLKYACRIHSQDSGEEIIQDLKTMVRDLLQEYKCIEGDWPQQILFFRDGVSETKYLDILRYEGVKILEAAKEAANYKPELMIILAVKRHHTRFFIQDKEGHWINIRQGTVVDKGVTHPKDYDFFLCSQAPLKGTSHATHYYVLLDQINLGQKKLYNLIYSLCHTYQRCTRSVSLVTPVYYSHLAAFRAKHYMENFLLERTNRGRKCELNAHPNLRNRLWFL